MTSRTLIVGVVAAALSVSPAWGAGKPKSISWGKPNISFERYRADALDCANQTYGARVSMTPKTIRALAALNGASLYDFYTGIGFENPGRPGYQAALLSVMPDRVVFRSTTYTSTYRVAEREDVIAQLQAIEDQCLLSRGYQRFRLTATQRERLHTLRWGTDERQHYLYTLGSDPQVVRAQSI